MRHIFITLCLPVILAACATGQGLLQSKTPDTAVADTPADAPTLRPKLRPAQTGVTVAEADATTNTQTAATKPTTRPEQDKGTTIASLGLLDRSGLWLQTPLVTSESEGRAVYTKTGASVNLTLVPNGAAAGSGSQISLAAMQVLGIPLTELATVHVFVR